MGMLREQRLEGLEKWNLFRDFLVDLQQRIEGFCEALSELLKLLAWQESSDA